LFAQDYSNMLKSQFIVGTNPLEIVDFGANFIGRLIGNFMGSRYTMFDNGIKLTPKQRQINESKEDAEKEKEKALGGGEERNVMGSVQFEGTVTKKVRTGRRMSVWDDRVCGQVERGPRRRRKVESDRRAPAETAAAGGSDGVRRSKVTLVGMRWTAERRVPAQHHRAAGHI
jgi:hypothetical protein